MYFKHKRDVLYQDYQSQAGSSRQPIQNLKKQGPEMLRKYLLQSSMSQAESDPTLHQNRNTKHFSSRHMYWTQNSNTNVNSITTMKQYTVVSDAVHTHTQLLPDDVQVQGH